MMDIKKKQLKHFHQQVVLKYHLYNGLFLTLPFGQTEEMGTLLSIFAKYCQVALGREENPQKIVEDFFAIHVGALDETQRINPLFKMLQFIERQVVLFDALEDAAFADIHDLSGPGSLHDLLVKVDNHQQQRKFYQEMQDYRVKIVLTAHPTQFYPDPILAILTQLESALGHNDLARVSELLLQMGKTSFRHQQKPTPYQEAHSLVWYLENIFYTVIPEIQQEVAFALSNEEVEKNEFRPNVELGFWPGGDRDGNPNVTAHITLEVARLLKSRILRMYVLDMRVLIKKLTFSGVLERLEKIKLRLEQTLLYAQLALEQKGSEWVTDQVNHLLTTGEHYQQVGDLLADLFALRNILIAEHEGLFLEHLDAFILKIQCFRFYFSAMDMRENAKIHHQALIYLGKELVKHNNYSSFKDELLNYEQLPELEKTTVLHKLCTEQVNYSSEKIPDSCPPTIANCFKSLAVIRKIQEENGEKGLCRYVISNTGSASAVLELYALLKISAGFEKNIPMDIIPLFESIVDLKNAENIMAQLIKCPFYFQHLQDRNRIQYIMLGFSDGTKDGGYVTANWSIYQAKIRLTALAEQCGVTFIFFDGRGGPPARGGGNTHAFYRSLGNTIYHQQLQLTVQGQTISVNFGTFASAKYNVEQLLTAGLMDLIFPEEKNDLTTAETELMNQLSELSQEAYTALKEDSLFVPYLEHMTPLQFFGDLNVGSRPTVRENSRHLKFVDLRAIPFVGSWSQLKQNVPGYYGFGYALNQLVQQGRLNQLRLLYQHSLFFRTLVENTMMSLSKTYFPLTSYMQSDKTFGKFWQRLASEAELTKRMLLTISEQNELLENDPVNRDSIKLREEIVRPLLVIQQYALMRLRELPDQQSALYSAYKKMVLKAMAANTNASRNSA